MLSEEQQKEQERLAKASPRNSGGRGSSPGAQEKPPQPDAVIEQPPEKVSGFEELYRWKMHVNPSFLDQAPQESSNLVQFSQSTLEGILHGFMVDCLLKHDEYCLQIIKQIERLMKKKGMRGMRKDWYRPYISEVRPVASEDNILPYIEVNAELLKKSIKEIQPIIERTFDAAAATKRAGFQQCVHTPHTGLILNYLKNKFYGIRPNKHIFEYAYGESLHCHHWEIHKVNFVTKLHNKKFNKVQKFFKRNYKGLALRANKSIPNWASLVQSNNVITLSGVPTPKDLGQYIVQIWGEKSNIIREFTLKIITDEDFAMRKSSVNSLSVFSNYIEQQDDTIIDLQVSSRFHKKTSNSSDMVQLHLAPDHSPHTQQRDRAKEEAEETKTDTRNEVPERESVDHIQRKEFGVTRPAPLSLYLSLTPCSALSLSLSPPAARRSR